MPDAAIRPPARKRSSVSKTRFCSLRVYYREYQTLFHIGLAFGMSESHSCRIVHQIESTLLADKRLHLPGKKGLHGTGSGQVAIIDVSEHPVERPKKGQRHYYWGKKKRHTLKSQVVIVDGKAVCLFGDKGRRHDFKVFKESGVSFGGSIERVAADGGYQGLQKQSTRAVLPVKGSKKKSLTKEDKKHNRDLASSRIGVAHFIRRMKIFRIVKETYRNRRKRYFLRLNLIAAICNFLL